MKCYIWSIALYGAQTWTLRKVDQKDLESFELLGWRRMEKISWTDHVRSEEALNRVNRVKEERNSLHITKRGKANCLLNHVIEGKLEIISDGKTRMKTWACTARPWINSWIPEIEGGSTKWCSAENSLWKGIWTCRKRIGHGDYDDDTGLCC